jgi:hypothetical protein
MVLPLLPEPPTEVVGAGANWLAVLVLEQLIKVMMEV